MLAGALRGLDAFVFTAGIGENSARIRARISEKLDWLGVTLSLRRSDGRRTYDRAAYDFVIKWGEVATYLNRFITLTVMHRVSSRLCCQS
jgi:hypothetical protein